MTIYGADGSKLDQFDCGAMVLDLSWSADGQQLAVMCRGSHIVILWKPKQKVSTKLALDIEDPLCIDQSKVSKLLAVGSSQGHLFIYNSFTSSRATISSKHTRRITSLQFTHQSDYIVTLSPELLCVTNPKGDTVAQLRQKQIGGYFLNRV